MISDRVFNLKTLERTGTVDLRQRGRRYTFRFLPEAIGSPRTYRWKAFMWEGSGDGPPSDRAPNRGFRRHRLG